MGIATYDSTIHFYQPNNSHIDCVPNMFIVSDIEDVFVPIPSLLMSLKKERKSISNILKVISNIFPNNNLRHSCAGAAITVRIF